MAIKRKYVVFLCLILIPASGSAQPGRRRVNDGNRAYAGKRFDAALDAYQDALIDNPQSSVIHFNMGDALYQMKDYEKALESFDRALETDDPLFQSRTHYNQGNTLYRAGRLQESIQAYEKALKLNPDDEDARYNLEFVRNRLKQDAQPEQSRPQDQQDQEQQPDGQEQQENREQQEQQQQQQQQEQQQDQQQDQEQESRDSGDAEEPEEERQARPEPGHETAMTPEEAERLLNALQEDQEELQKQKARASVGSGKTDKDW